MRPAAESSAAAWTCPFCALLCDGFAVDRSGSALRLLGSDCPRARRALADFSAAPPPPATLGGKAVAHDVAIGAAAELLRGARLPLFGGLATDVDGTRSLYALANVCHAVLDHAASTALLPGLRTLQDRGVLLTTLAEIRNRADLVVCFGTQPARDYPEFYRRCGVGSADSPLREVVFLGSEVDPACSALAPQAARSVPWSVDAWTTLAQLNALSRDRRVAAPEALHDLVRRLLAARYIVFVWEPARLPGPHGALLVESINQLAKTLNRTTRAGGLALAGSDGALAVNQALGWLSGLPLRTAVLASGLQHDPHRYAAEALLAGHAVDALLWVASFGPQTVPPATSVPTIVLGHPTLAARSESARVFIPVATPGIGADGHLFRVDGMVVVPVHKVREDGLPTVAAVAREIRLRLAEGEVAS